MSTEAIYAKYWSALMDVEAVMVPADTAIALALRLAVQDAYGEGSALADDLAAIVASLAQPAPDQRQQESLQAQISRLNEWLADNAPALYHNPELDTADAVLAELGVRDRRQIEQSAAIADLRYSLKDANEDAASARQELVTLIAERDSLAHSNGNGNGVDPTTTPEWNRNHPAWDGLSDEQRVTVYRLASGDLRFRKISKEDRIDLVGRVLRHLAADGEPVTAPKFDRLRPNWMPTAGAVVLLAESRKWQELLVLTLAPAPS